MAKLPGPSARKRERPSALLIDPERTTIESIAGKIGCTAETLRRWVRQGERDGGVREGPTTAEQQRVRELEREVRELRRANEILKLSSSFFAQAELDRRLKS